MRWYVATESVFLESIMDTNIMTVLALGSDVLHDVMCNDNVSIRFTISTSESFTKSLLKMRKYMYLASHFSFAAVNAYKMLIKQ